MKINLANKISSFLEKLDDKQRYYIFGGMLLALFLFDYYLLMRPQITSLSKISPEIRILKSDLKKTTEDIQKIDDYKKEIIQLKEVVKKIDEKVKRKEEVPLILERISRIASRNSIQINQIKPNPEGKEVVLEAGVEEYYYLPVVLQAKASYHNFGKFINDVENDELLLRLKDFTLSATENSKEHLVQLTLKAVVVGDAPKKVIVPDKAKKKKSTKSKKKKKKK